MSESADGHEFGLHLVEEGPWPENELTDNLYRVQDRLYTTFEGLVEGQIAEQYPATAGHDFRIEVDFIGDCPARLRELVAGFHELINRDPIYTEQVRDSRSVGTVGAVLNVLDPAALGLEH